VLAVALVLGGAQAKHSSHGQASNSGSVSGSWLVDRLVRLPPDTDPGARASQAQAGAGAAGRLGCAGAGGVAGEQVTADLPLRSCGSWW